MQNLNYISFPLLAAQSFMCGLAVYFWRLTLYNTRKLPPYIRPARDYMETEHPYYCPASESRRGVGGGFFPRFSAYYGIIKPCPQTLEPVFPLYACLPACYVLHRCLCLHKANGFTPAWGFDESRYRFTPREELERILWWEHGLLRKKESPCWVLLFKRKRRYGRSEYAVEISADLWVKQGEMNLREDELLYIKGYPNVSGARRAAHRLIARPKEQEARILEMNPERRNLNDYSSQVLSEY